MKNRNITLVLIFNASSKASLSFCFSETSAHPLIWQCWACCCCSCACTSRGWRRVKELMLLQRKVKGFTTCLTTLHLIRISTQLQPTRVSALQPVWVQRQGCFWFLSNLSAPLVFSCSQNMLLLDPYGHCICVFHFLLSFFPFSHCFPHTIPCIQSR